MKSLARYMNRDFPFGLSLELVQAQFAFYLNQDFPDGLRPTTAVGLSDEYIANREISKHLSCSAEGVSGRCQAMMPPKTPCVGAFIGDLRRPSPLPPRPPAVSTVLAVIPAPSRAA